MSNEGPAKPGRYRDNIGAHRESIGDPKKEESHEVVYGQDVI